MRRKFVRFGLVLVGLWTLAFVVAALVGPPDPVTQLVYAAPLAVAAVPLAYWLAGRVDG